MTFFMQRDGWKFLANMIAGSSLKIDGMYAEYSDSGIVINERSHDKYKLDSNIKYIRVPIANAYVDDNNVVNFTGYIDESDIPKDISENSAIRCITLVSFDKEYPDRDILVSTVGLKAPVKLLNNTYIVLHAGFKLGDIK